MERRATITLRERATDPPVLVSEGFVDRIGDSWNVRYNDGEADYTIGVSDDMVTVTRCGAEDYTMILSEGKEYPFGIESPFGEVRIAVTPTAVRIKSSDNGLSVRVAYEISSGDVRRKFRLYIDCVYADDSAQ